MRTLSRLLRAPDRRATIRTLIVALLVAVICWYFGADVWHSILLGGAITTVGVTGLVGTALDARDLNWRSGGRTNREGSRGDVAALSWSVRGSYGRVGSTAVRRVNRIARQRLALRHLDLSDPADRLEIERLIGRRAYAVLVRGERRPPLLRSLLRCLDALDALDPGRRPPPPPPRPRRRMTMSTPRSDVNPTQLEENA